VCLGVLAWHLVKQAPRRDVAPDAGARTGADERSSEQARVLRITTAALAGAIVLWLTSKVLSPQYLTWGIPLVLAVPGRAGKRLAWIAIGAMAVTQLYTRGFYDLVVEQAPIALVTLAVRQGLLVALLVLALRAFATGATSSGATTAKPAPAAA